MSESLTITHFIWAIWANERWANEQIPNPALLQLAVIGLLVLMLALRLWWSMCDANSSPVGCVWFVWWLCLSWAYDGLCVMLTLLQLFVNGLLVLMLALRLRWSVCDADSSPVGCEWSASINACPEAMMICLWCWLFSSWLLMVC